MTKISPGDAYEIVAGTAPTPLILLCDHASNRVPAEYGDLGLAPAQFVSPAGTAHAIDYDDPGGPSVEVRVQALFGLDRHPGFGQPTQPLLLKLTDPGGKPLQTTRDLPGFWRGSWKDVQRDMKGRYPKHRWPDAPWAEDPSLKTKNAFEASRRS